MCAHHSLFSIKKSGIIVRRYRSLKTDSNVSTYAYDSNVIQSYLGQ